MRKALTYQKSNRTQKNSAQGTNVTKNLRQLKENRAQGTNVPYNQTELTENSAQDTNKTIGQNSKKALRKALT